MTRFLVLSILCLSLQSEGQAQFSFNQRETLHSFSTVLTTVLPTSDGYLCTGVGWDSANYIGNGQAWPNIGVKFTRFRLDGRLLQDTVYERSHFLHGWQGKRTLLAGTNSTRAAGGGKYITIATSLDTGDIMRAAVIVFDSNGKAVAFKEFDHPNCPNVKYPQAFFQPYSLVSDGVGGWLMLSSVSCMPVKNLFYLTRLDSNLDTLWTKQYSTNQYNHMAAKLLVEPDGYLLAGSTNNQNIAVTGFDLRAKLIKVDTAGNVLWTWTSDPGKLIQLADIARTPDGGYVYCGTVLKERQVNSQSAEVYPKNWVEKLYVTRNVQWSLPFGDTFGGYTGQTVIRALPNGDYVVAGTTTDTGSWWTQHGSLTRVTPNGAVRWLRRYHFAKDTFIYQIHDMQLTADGGFVLVGQVRDPVAPFSPPNQRAWIVKADSNGCLGPGDSQCWPASVPVVVPIASHPVVVYPNPVQDVLKVSYGGEAMASLIVTDVQGREVLRSDVGYGQTLLDVHHLAPGVYLWRITDGSTKKASGKFVKQ